MNSLEERKIKKEIEVLTLECKQLRRHPRVDLLKFIIGIFAAILSFVLIQHPELILNQKSKDEEVARERAKLLLNVMDDKNPKSRNLKMQIIKGAYSVENVDWIEKIDKDLSSATRKEIVKITRKRIDSLNNEIEQLKLMKQNNTLSDFEKRMIYREIEVINSDIEEEKKELKSYEG